MMLSTARSKESMKRFIFVGGLCLSFLAQGLATETNKAGGPVKVAVSEDGHYRLSLAETGQGPSPWDENRASISASFRLESRAEAAGDFMQQVPEDVFLENVEVAAVELLSGKDVAGEKASQWVDSSALKVTLQHLEVGDEQRRLGRLKLVVTLVKVTEWELVEFNGIQKADEKALHCGPFELVVCEAQPRHLSVSAAAFSSHAREHEAYRERMPLQFLTHRYATRELRLTDSAGKRLGFSAGTFTGGGSSARYAIHKGMPLTFAAKEQSAGEAPSSFFGEAEDIRYPVTATLRLPRKYVSERAVFEFRDVELPALKREK